MRRRRRAKQQGQWSRARMLILAVTFFAATALGTLGLNAVSRMSQMAALETGHHAQCVGVKPECECNKIKDKRTGKCVGGENKFKCTCIEPKTGEKGQCFLEGCCARNPSGCGKGEPKGGEPKGGKKEEPKGEGGKPPELPKPPEKPPKDEKPKDDKCQQDPNSAECKQSQKPFYCNIMASLPGCGGNEGQLPETASEDDAGQAISDIAGSSPAPSSESGGSQSPTPSPQPTVPTDAQKVGAQEHTTNSSAGPNPESSQNYTPPATSFGAPPPPLTQEQRASAWWTLESIKNTLLNWWPF